MRWYNERRRNGGTGPGTWNPEALLDLKSVSCRMWVHLGFAMLGILVLGESRGEKLETGPVLR